MSNNNNYSKQKSDLFWAVLIFILVLKGMSVAHHFSKSIESQKVIRTHVDGQGR